MTNVIDIELRLDDCMNVMNCSNVSFTQWEKEFLNSVYEQFDNVKSLSKKQSEILERIWEKI